MKIKTALTIFTALTLVVFGALAITLMRSSSLLAQQATSLVRAGENIRVSQEIKSHLLIFNRHVFLHALHKHPSRLEASKLHLIALTSLLVSSDQQVDSDEEAAALSDVKAKIEAYLQEKDKSQNSDSTPVEKYIQVSEKVDVAINTIDKVIEINISQMRNLVGRISQQNLTSDRIVSVLLFLASLILIGLVTAIIFTVVLPLATLSKVISQYNIGSSILYAKPRGLNEIREITNNYNSMTERLEESRNDQLSYIATIAHDLRNPISSMSMASELLIGESEKRDSGIAQVIFRQVKHLDRLVGDLLDTTRIEAGEMDIELSLQDVSSLISDAVELHQTDSGIHKLNIEMTKRPLFCNCDRGRLTQVMNNLISNAIKYSPTGGIVTVKAWEEDSQLIVSVADQGIGVSPHDLNNIFKPFHRSKATKGVIPGIGLGLSASRKIVALHGGELKVESTLGKGSTFFLVLPTQGKVQHASRSEIPEVIDLNR